ncbi:ComEC/Rec2 family competence protein [Algoriphagus hitonicola]|uniref:Competence protein ComEC n=1 Tax=Algoriphagus hitonicola TaxID=435880 RepID=A0A1I2WA68_9BACT|nr:ComEC/Rec2 family competence protein [Algoriphagus hitonicola]SFG98255.1 competence protein ComEC [Algoriphagus hitonicola]
MRFSDFPFLRYLPFLLLGIFLGKSGIHVEWELLAISLIGVSFLFGFLVIHRKSMKTRSILAYFQLLLLGLFCESFQREFVSGQSQVAINQGYIAEVQEYDLQKPNSFQNLLSLRFIQTEDEWLPAGGNILVYHQSEKPLNPGDLIWVREKPEEVPSPVNPHEFDYRGYLAKQGIYYRQFLGENFTLIEQNAGFDFSFLMVYWRKEMATMLSRHIQHEKAQQIALALLLGQKQELDRDTKKAFSEAGVMHVLAVSGLHVGILVGVLLLLIKPLKLKKGPKRFYLIGVLLVIWIYAMLTGMAPSVIRASVMFSLLTLGQLRERRPSIFNILAFSAILMIVLDPDVIFEVGFQLSYLAVAGIVLIQPLIARLWLPQTVITEYFWQLASVSIAAQLATFPLSIYYFHTFPTWFLLANMIVIPLTFISMQLGIPLMMVGWIESLGNFLGFITELFLRLEIWVLDGFKELPFSSFQFLTISVYGMLAVWMLLLLWAAWENYPKKRIIRFAAILLVGWVIKTGIDQVNYPDRQLVLYSSERGWFLDYWENESLYSWNHQVDPENLDFLVKPNRIQNQWKNFPKPLAVYKNQAGLLYFPSLDLKVDSKKKIFFGSPTQRGKLQYWTNGKWQAESNRDSLSLEGKSYRILF